MEVQETVLADLGVGHTLEDGEDGVGGELLGQSLDPVSNHVVGYAHDAREGEVVDVLTNEGALLVCAEENGHLVLSWDVELALH